MAEELRENYRIPTIDEFVEYLKDRDDVWKNLTEENKKLVKNLNIPFVVDSFNCLEQNIKGDKFKCKEHCGKCVK